MSGKQVGRVVAVLLGCGVIVLAAEPAFAHKTFLNAVKDNYKLTAANGKCNTCHGLKGGPNRKNLNPFGTAIQGDTEMKPLLGKKVDYVFTADELKAFLKSVATLDDKDTDGDGATNKEELALGTNPGDSDSKPVPATLEKFRKDLKDQKAKEGEKSKK